MCIFFHWLWPFTRTMGEKSSFSSFCFAFAYIIQAYNYMDIHQSVQTRVTEKSEREQSSIHTACSPNMYKIATDRAHDLYCVFEAEFLCLRRFSQTFVVDHCFNPILISYWRSRRKTWKKTASTERRKIKKQNKNYCVSSIYMFLTFAYRITNGYYFWSFGWVGGAGEPNPHGPFTIVCVCVSA